MGYSGLVLRENTTGNRIQRGAITKTGNAHLRRVLVESTWTYQHRPNVQGRVLRRQKALALSEEAKRIAWKAQQRLHKRFIAMAARGKERGTIVTALARELLGFMWAIAVYTEAQFRPTKAA
jgi:transposase